MMVRLRPTAVTTVMTWTDMLLGWLYLSSYSSEFHAEILTLIRKDILVMFDLHIGLGGFDNVGTVWYG